MTLAGKLALVTGSGSGIGKGIAWALARQGADVAVHYNSNAEAGEATAREIAESGVRAAAFGADLRQVAETERLASEVEAFFGRPIDILVNNAGHLVGRVANAEMTERHYEEVMNVNFKSCVFMSKAVIPAMAERREGAIVHVSSVAAHNGGGPGASVYAAAKAAMLAYAKGLAKELAGSGIRVNAVSPGVIGQTAFHDTFTPEDARAATLKTIPLGREGAPEDVGNAVVYLVSAQSAYVTGQTIEINGGMFMR
ncbi:SDR family NAD(P)-dependent oxidoreductase [Cohnella hashimotonis]|uniref:Glucose 1-dehydrogenase n=1 Tax=Cohnella hashimotonis TaxID=2826895 RepID=A0ABT6TQ30_9BACL|nr:glucose 1-dehydrogenase [Cohnella hashimotonis]MDI4648966.1 glucose 1-dehydrogenase [Cohnella hashimotonis]